MAPDKKQKGRNKKITLVQNSKKELKTSENGSANGSTDMTEEEALCAKLDEEARINAEARACTGSLAVHPRSRDIKFANFSITFFGSEMLQDKKFI